MKSRTQTTLTSNDDQVRFRIFAGELPLDEAKDELLRMERAQHNAERLRHQQARENLVEARTLIANLRQLFGSDVRWKEKY